MAHFAKLDENNIVLEVLVVDNREIIRDDVQEDEQLGIELLKGIFENSNWKQTSYNSQFRKNYAGIGYSYDETADAFIPPKPYPSWVLDENDYQWKFPIPHPDDNLFYVWDEDTVGWKLVP